MWQHDLKTEIQLTIGSNATLNVIIMIRSYFIVRPIVDQRAGQLCLPHIGVTKTEISMSLVSCVHNEPLCWFM